MGARMIRLALAAAGLAVAAAAVAFALLNNEPVALDLYFARYTRPLALWLVLFLIVGIVIGLLVPARALLRQRRRARRLDADLRRLHARTGQGPDRPGGPAR